MSLPIGNWSINSHGPRVSSPSPTSMRKATSPERCNLIRSSTVNFTRTWDETTKKLSFSYHVGRFIFFRVSYTGYFFLAGQPLFGQVGPRQSTYVGYAGRRYCCRSANPLLVRHQ